MVCNVSGSCAIWCLLGLSNESHLRGRLRLKLWRCGVQRGYGCAGWCDGRHAYIVMFSSEFSEVWRLAVNAGSLNLERSDSFGLM